MNVKKLAEMIQQELHSNGHFVNADNIDQDEDDAGQVYRIELGVRATDDRTFSIVIEDM